MPTWTLLFSTILLPLFSIALLWRRPPHPRTQWATTFIMALGLTGFSVLAAPWGWFGMGVRLLLVLLFVAALAASLRRPVRQDALPESPLRNVVKVLIGIFFGTVALGVLRAHTVPPGTIDLAFPLRGGRFLIQHGGSDSAANMHASHPAQRYALDIVKLNAAWTRARGLYPGDLTRYAIWNDAVLSPCDGTVLAAVDRFPDNEPGMRDEKNPEGNQVVLRCGDADVVLAHLRRGSVSVKPHARVAAGAIVGRVGNSGNATEPHLHVHAERAGAAVPARFEGRWLVRNAIVTK